MSGLKTKTLILKKNVFGCCEIILNQPKKHNALSPLMIKELDTVFDELKEDSVNFQDADKEAIAETLWKHALKKYHNAHMYIFKEDMLMIINENER